MTAYLYDRKYLRWRIYVPNQKRESGAFFHSIDVKKAHPPTNLPTLYIEVRQPSSISLAC